MFGYETLSCEKTACQSGEKKSIWPGSLPILIFKIPTTAQERTIIMTQRLWLARALRTPGARQSDKNLRRNETA